MGVKPENDAFGQENLAHLLHKESFEVIERDYGFVDFSRNSLPSFLAKVYLIPAPFVRMCWSNCPSTRLTRAGGYMPAKIMHRFGSLDFPKAIRLILPTTLFWRLRHKTLVCNCSDTASESLHFGNSNATI
jgi:hypothetical protein